MRKVIVAVAPVAQAPDERITNPLTPEEVGRAVVECARAGASLVHLHARDARGQPTADLTAFRQTVDVIRSECDLIIQGSTGGLSSLSLEERCVCLDDSRVECASLNMGSANFGESVYVNTLPDIRFWASRMRERGIRPELEVFDAGMVNNARILAEEGILDPPFVFAFCLGIRGALPAEPANLHFLSSIVPTGSRWGLIHHGMTDLSLLAAAVGFGACFVRVGFEDSIHLAPNRVARSNAELVERVVALLEAMGVGVARPEEAREMLELKGRREMLRLKGRQSGGAA